MQPLSSTPSRIHFWQWSMLLLAAAAIVTAQAGWVDLHRLFKPLVMVIALLAVARIHCTPTNDQLPGTRRWLLAALAFSLVGDVCLMFHNLFIPGLVAFLCAHLCYIRLFCLDAPWLPRRTPLLVCGLLAAGFYGYLWRHLPADLRLPVAAYVLVITLMVAQATGRACLQRTLHARSVAAGAMLFMLSDTLLALDRFAHPLTWSAFGVLSTYYAAQWLIVHGMLQRLAVHRPTAQPAHV